MRVSDATHAILLHLLDQLTGEEAEALRGELAATHESFTEQLAALACKGGGSGIKQAVSPGAGELIKALCYQQG